LLMTEDATQGTVGWFAWGTGTVGITKGQTLRLSMVNLVSSNVNVLCGIWSNPRLVQDSFALQPGESRECDLKATEIERAIRQDGARSDPRICEGQRAHDPG